MLDKLKKTAGFFKRNPKMVLSDMAGGIAAGVISVAAIAMVGYAVKLIKESEEEQQPQDNVEESASAE